MKNKPKKQGKGKKVIDDYDFFETAEFINKSRPLKFEDIGVKIPPSPPTQVISIRLPTRLLNELKALGSEQDVPYQALIKLLLNDGVQKLKKKSA